VQPGRVRNDIGTIFNCACDVIPRAELRPSWKSSPSAAVPPPPPRAGVPPVPPGGLKDRDRNKGKRRE
jgi:hypothetical protein